MALANQAAYAVMAIAAPARIDAVDIERCVTVHAVGPCARVVFVEAHGISSFVIPIHDAIGITKA